MKRSHPILLLLSAARSCHGLDASLTTGFAGTNQANGNIFTIKAKGGQPVSVTSLDINMSGPPSPNPAPVEVHFLPGIDPGYSDPSNPYQRIYQDEVAGQGKGNVTSLPPFASPVVIPAGATYSFYVTVADLWLGTNLWYNIGSGVGSVVASDNYVEVGEGYALGYPFLGHSAERRWNGNIYYSVASAPSTGSPVTLPTSPPTKTPTPKATTSSPTPDPDGDGLDPTESPTTLSPVRSPTGSPAGSPTPNPSSRSPTRWPDSSNLPTRPPVDDSLDPPPSAAPSDSAAPSEDSQSVVPSGGPSEGPDSDSGSPTLTSSPSSLGPTKVLDSFLPIQPSAAVGKGVCLGRKIWIVVALSAAVANYSL